MRQSRLEIGFQSHFLLNIYIFYLTTVIHFLGLASSLPRPNLLLPSPNFLDMKCPWGKKNKAELDPFLAARMITNWIRAGHPRGATFHFSEIQVVQVPQQVGKVHCGIHIISYMLNLAQGEPISPETGLEFANVRRDEYAQLLARAARDDEPGSLQIEDLSTHPSGDSSRNI